MPSSHEREIAALFLSLPSSARLGCVCRKLYITNRCPWSKLLEVIKLVVFSSIFMIRGSASVPGVRETSANAASLRTL